MPTNVFPHVKVAKFVHELIKAAQESAKGDGGGRKLIRVRGLFEFDINREGGLGVGVDADTTVPVSGLPVGLAVNANFSRGFDNQSKNTIAFEIVSEELLPLLLPGEEVSVRDADMAAVR